MVTNRLRLGEWYPDMERNGLSSQRSLKKKTIADAEHPYIDIFWQKGEGS
ncbi:MAG: hypothetical protein J7647_21290 [Cyanobacteria bacterium SBLK]|nr:hypothetical protein [Cyanobacteria bacterium SBLK]